MDAEVGGELALSKTTLSVDQSGGLFIDRLWLSHAPLVPGWDGKVVTVTFAEMRCGDKTARECNVDD